MYRTWLLLSACVLAVVLSLAGCRPAAGVVPMPSPNAAPATPAADAAR